VPEVVVAEGSLALAIRIAGERAGTLAAQARHVPEAADRIVGADAANEVADRPATDVRQRRAGHRTDVAPREGPDGASHAAVGIRLVERGHLRPPFRAIV
jgi:hypothetical protein